MKTGQNKVVLITGSGKKRVGYHIALAFAKKGYDIIINFNESEAEAMDTVNELKNLGAHAIAIKANLSNEAEIDQFISSAYQSFQKIDVLVNSASIWKPKSLETTSAEDLINNFKVNTLATFLCCQKIGLKMAMEASGGNIILIGDSRTERPYKDYSAYFTSKGCLPTITKTLAVEFATRNPMVRVNCITPGPVLSSSDSTDTSIKRASESTLLKKLGTPENVAQAAIFLVENDFITGITLPVDGGISLN
jgi:pteridine reductase